MSGHALLVEDHPLFRAGFGASWSSQPSRPRLYVAGSIVEARYLLARHIFGLVIVDVMLPDGCGLDLVVETVRAASVVVVLTTYVRPAVSLAVRQLGASEILSKEADPEELMSALDRLRARPTTGRYPTADTAPSLSDRERDVLRLLLSGASNPDIARVLSIGVETVKTHVGSVMDKLGVRNRYEAIQRARDLGFDVALPFLGDATNSSTT